MLILLGIISGALIGQWHARRLGGTNYDRIHYSIVYAIVFALIGVAVTIVLGWSVL